MLKKIILPLVLFISTQHEFYGMENGDNSTHNEKTESDLQKNKWWEFLEPNFVEKQCLRYHIRALFNNFFRKWCGVYKRVELSYGELYFGTVNGIGWYPQFLNFHDHFRMGLFELSYNAITTLFRIFRDFFTKGEHDFSLGNIVIHFIGGFNFSIINFKIYNNLIRLNVINIFLTALVYFNTKEKFCYNYYSDQGGEYNNILFFGKDLPILQDSFNRNRIKYFLLLLNLILPEIYIDINIINSRDKGQP